MEKNLEFISKLESRIDTIANLVSQLKEDNVELLKQNESLKFKLQLANGTMPNNSGTKIQEPPDSPGDKGILESQSEDVRRRVQSALFKLNQLRQAVLEAS